MLRKKDGFAELYKSKIRKMEDARYLSNQEEGIEDNFYPRPQGVKRKIKAKKGKRK